MCDVNPRMFKNFNLSGAEIFHADRLCVGVWVFGKTGVPPDTSVL